MFRAIGTPGQGGIDDVVSKHRTAGGLRDAFPGENARLLSSVAGLLPVM